MAGLAKNHVAALVRVEKTHLAELCNLLDILCQEAMRSVVQQQLVLEKVNVQQEPAGHQPI
jgi:hypothetical protein